MLYDVGNKLCEMETLLDEETVIYAVSGESVAVPDHEAVIGTWGVDLEIDLDLNYESAPAYKTVTGRIGDALDLSEYKPEREGYTFAGWTLEEDGSGE